MYLTSSFDEKICFVSRNFPLESHKKIASFERVLLLLLLLVVDAEVAVFCVSCPRACLPLAIGFVGGTCRGEKELDVGRFTTSNSFSFHWSHFGDGFSYSLSRSSSVPEIVFSSTVLGGGWLDGLLLVISGEFNFSQSDLI